MNWVLGESSLWRVLIRMLQENLISDNFLNKGYFKLLIVTMRDTVKINKDLLKRVEDLVKQKDKKIRYAHKKQFVEVAVLNLLESEESGN